MEEKICSFIDDDKGNILDIFLTAKLPENKEEYTAWCHKIGTTKETSEIPLPGFRRNSEIRSVNVSLNDIWNGQCIIPETEEEKEKRAALFDKIKNSAAWMA